MKSIVRETVTDHGVVVTRGLVQNRAFKTKAESRKAMEDAYHKVLVGFPGVKHVEVLHRDEIVLSIPSWNTAKDEPGWMVVKWEVATPEKTI